MTHCPDADRESPGSRAEIRDLERQYGEVHYSADRSTVQHWRDLLVADFAADPFWFCNKCGLIGRAPSVEQANEQHGTRAPECHYAPAWNYSPPLPPTSSLGAATAKSQVRLNAEQDPTYRPYCMRCSGLVRMQIVEPFYWRCACGAEHDERRSPTGEPGQERTDEATS